MATGNGIKEWQTTAVIIPRTDKDGADGNYTLQYADKESENNILSLGATADYVNLLDASGLGELYFGDNLDVLRHLVHTLRGQVKLIYIDPPYATNSVFHTRTSHAASYRDDLTGAHYIEFMRQRLVWLRELLAEDGSIYLHLDGNMIAEMQVIMEEVFGTKNFRSFITRRKCSNKNSTRKTYGNVSDYLLFFSKSDNYTWNRPMEGWTPEKIAKEYQCVEAGSGRRYKKVPIHAPGIRNGQTGQPWRGLMPPPGKHWQYVPDRLDELDQKGEIYWSATGNPRRKVYLDTTEGISVQDIWLDVPDSVNQNSKSTGYPTEKNPQLLARIIEASSNPGDLVMDCFAGSGTTLGVAQEKGRRWLGVDNSMVAVECIFRRFFNGVVSMGDYVTVAGKQQVASNGQVSLFENAAPSAANVAKDALGAFSFYCDSRYRLACNKLAEFDHMFNANL